ncbi:tetratricopeptide repeat protein, partial [Marichromatium bheemlicum]
MVSNDESLELARAHHAAGRLDEAESLYRARLTAEPDEAAAHHGLGVLEVERGHLDSGLGLLLRALELDPENGHHWESYAQGLMLAYRPQEGLAVIERAIDCGLDSAEAHALREMLQRMLATPTPSDEDALITLFERHQFDEVEQLARDWTERRPWDAFGWKMLGAVLAQCSRGEAAVPVLEEALRRDDQDPQVLNTLGVALEQVGRLEEAGLAYAQAAKRSPDFVAALYNLASLLLTIGRAEEAIGYFDAVLAIDPRHLKSYNNRGSALRRLGRTDEALADYQQALDVDPDHPETLTNLGNALAEQGRFDEALALQQHAVRLRPGQAAMLSNLGNILQLMGRVDEAATTYRQALSKHPTDAAIHSKLLFTLNYHPGLSAKAIFTDYREFDRRHGEPARAHWSAHDNDRDPGRRLRLGYVSPDFRHHSTRHMLEPLLMHRNRLDFELFAYAELTCEDAQTARYQGLIDHWVPTCGLSDAQLAERIRADGIDILVDLAGHTAGNRLGGFARKPAPVSVSLWVGYGYTSGLSAIDYFLCDEALVPEGAEGLFSERPWRIAAPAGMYRPSEGMGAVNVLPALERGYITFGTLTRGVRVNHRTIRVWSEILERVPGARLVVNS